MADVKNLPSQNVFEVEGVTFSSNFDNGNLAKVVKLKSAMPYDYKVWVAPDNQGTVTVRDLDIRIYVPWPVFSG